MSTTHPILIGLDMIESGIAARNKHLRKGWFKTQKFGPLAKISLRDIEVFEPENPLLIQDDRVRKGANCNKICCGHGAKYDKRYQAHLPEAEFRLTCGVHLCGVDSVVSLFGHRDVSKHGLGFAADEVVLCFP